MSPLKPEGPVGRQVPSDEIHEHDALSFLHPLQAEESARRLTRALGRSHVSILHLFRQTLPARLGHDGDVGRWRSYNAKEPGQSHRSERDAKEPGESRRLDRELAK